MRVLCLLAPPGRSFDELAPSLLALAQRFTPAVEMAFPSPRALYLDISGIDLALLGRDGPAGEVALVQALLAVVEGEIGLRPCAAVGPGKFVARVAAAGARPGEPCWIAPAAERSALAAAPIATLPCSEEMRRRLHLFGLRNLGEFLALPFGPVQAQFGGEGARLWRRAAGLELDPLVPRPLSVAPAERLELPAPLADWEALARAAGVLLRRLFRRPEVGNRLVRRLTLQIEMENGHAWERTIPFRDATASVDRAGFVIRSRLETLTLPAAAVAMTMTLRELCGERGRQESLFSARGRRLAQIDETVRHLQARLGIVPILRFVAVEPWSRIPERHAALMEYFP